jgi:predicted nucleic acid-binding protein
MKDRSLSYADCVGYITARKFGIPFLTGDKEFKDMEGVIFIK